ncbi:MAG: MBL fold metallo-hydrolase [Gammaproteobacteria bacterium]|nr:MBL fold metallo-hydrolase [Gammaproteobacteria bacterium]MDD9896249.1 MBL fold metallo-hydrolase [Gammaproteobacteria bacterium]MDD9959543.1 MBL fold metallo-hydrolase [Gammaproteobacteria bacterium]
MIFQQLFEPLSNSYTYLFGCEETGKAVLVDPVVPTLERDLEAISKLGMKLVSTLETHIHADHITAALALREAVNCKIGFPAIDNLPCADIHIKDEEPLRFGSIAINPIFTPGHTDDHFSFLVNDKLLSGDSLLIDGCGRTDFQNGDAAILYRSITEKLFRLPDETLVYPGHDYNARWVSSIAQEKARNSRIAIGTSEAQFVKTMAELKLPHPNFIDYAVPGNLLCGQCPSDLPENMEKYCQQMTESPQG